MTKREAPEASVHIVPIPLRQDLTAMLQVPFDLSMVEAEKIARVAIALADGEKPEK